MDPDLFKRAVYCFSNLAGKIDQALIVLAEESARLLLMMAKEVGLCCAYFIKDRLLVN
jgi:hypothetical protein